MVASVINGNALWLREGPSTSAAGLTMMYRGETIIVLEKGEPWSRVQYGGLTGYAMSQYLEFREVPVEPEEPEDPEEPDEPIWGETEPGLTATIINGDALWLREGPSTSAAGLTKMYRGETVTVLEKGDTWSRVQYGNLTGYAMSQYLLFAEEGGEAPVDPGWDDPGQGSEEPDEPMIRSRRARPPSATATRCGCAKARLPRRRR